MFDRTDNSLFGHVVDLSENGLLITCDRQLNANKKYCLAIEDTTLMDRFDTLNFNAQCRWHAEDETSLLIDGGFEFVAPSHTIKDMVSQYAA